jgi:hypothetical protein
LIAYRAERRRADKKERVTVGGRPHDRLGADIGCGRNPLVVAHIVRN